jgi:hypothetical protein
MYPHRINLREPWQTRADDPLTFARVFRWPNELMPHEEVWLVLGAVYAPYTVIVNEQQLGIQPTARLPLEVNLTSVLRNQNLLEIACLEPPLKRVEHIYLEVRRTIHLQQLIGHTVWNGEQPQLRFTARLASPAERSLSLVVMLNQQEVLYQDLGKPSGRVEFNTPPLSVSRWLPGQVNELHQLELQLLDPACVLDQHTFVTGLAHPPQDPIRANNGVPVILPDGIPLHASPWLADADRAGTLVDWKPSEAFLPYVWHHPCLATSA